MIADRLAKAMCAAGVPASESVTKKLQNYLELLVHWQRSINLVGSRDPHTICDLHIADSLHVCRVIPAGEQRVIDVGSGAGLPGAIVAIARSDCEVTCLEPIHKKRSFIAAARRELELENLTAVAERLEEHIARDDFEPWDVAVSRATWPVSEWLERARALVHARGRIIAMEGAEKHSLPPGATRVPYVLKDRQRSLVVYTPERDPVSESP